MKKILFTILLISLSTGFLKAQSRTLNVDQLVTLEYKDWPLHKILDDLTQHYHIKFSYSREKALLDAQVTISLVSVPLSKGLNQLLVSHGLDYRIIGEQVVVRRKKPVPENEVHFIRGTVVDSQSRVPIPMASVYMPNKGVGTVSNAEGVFEFFVPLSHDLDTLLISYLGYESVRILLDFQSSDPMLIAMTEKPVVLDQVTITGEQLSANAIFQKAFENIEKSFPQEHFQLNGFFRQLDSENGKYVLLIESSIEIYDKGYHLNDNFNLQEKVAIRQSRVSKNYFKHEQQNFFDYHNTLKQLLVWNYTRYANPFVMGRKNFVIDTVTYLGDDPVYVISSTESKYTGDKLEGFNRFTLHIDCETFVIYQIKNETIAQPGYFIPMRAALIKGDRSKLLKWTATSHTYSFRRYLEKMYLSDARSLIKGQIINTNDNSVDREVSNEELLMINEILTENIEVPTKHLMDKKKGILFQNTAYDPQFWNDYRQVNLVPLTEKQEQDLEAEMPLEEQFRQSSETGRR